MLFLSGCETFCNFFFFLPLTPLWRNGNERLLHGADEESWAAGRWWGPDVCEYRMGRFWRWWFPGGSTYWHWPRNRRWLFEPWKAAVRALQIICQGLKDASHDHWFLNSIVTFVHSPFLSETLFSICSCYYLLIAVHVEFASFLMVDCVLFTFSFCWVTLSYCLLFVVFNLQKTRWQMAHVCEALTLILWPLRTCLNPEITFNTLHTPPTRKNKLRNKHLKLRHWRQHCLYWRTVCYLIQHDLCVTNTVLVEVKKILKWFQKFKESMPVKAVLWHIMVELTVSGSLGFDDIIGPISPLLIITWSYIVFRFYFYHT